jgi:hypothetical protein
MHIIVGYIHNTDTKQTMTQVTTISVKLNFGYLDGEQDGSMDPDSGTVDLAQLAGHVEDLIPTLDDLQDDCDGEDEEHGEGFEKVTEIYMRSFIPGTWTIASERTYRFEVKIDVRHIGHDLSRSVISKIVDAFFEAGANSSYTPDEPDIPHHVSYPVHWDAVQSESLLIDAREAIDYGDYERSIGYAQPKPAQPKPISHVRDISSEEICDIIRRYSVPKTSV